ncbi:hypothetical protein MC885_004739 [Smutsia gigantea]|nr:hypothetical protein MC885_004739 [Smutsia gigantea]
MKLVRLAQSLSFLLLWVPGTITQTSQNGAPCSAPGAADALDPRTYPPLPMKPVRVNTGHTEDCPGLCVLTLLENLVTSME